MRKIFNTKEKNRTRILPGFSLNKPIATRATKEMRNRLIIELSVTKPLKARSRISKSWIIKTE